MRTPIAITLLMMLAVACATPDAELRRRVDARLHAVQAPEDVDVSVNRRIVTLRGVVSSEREREHVAELVRSVDGVLAVDDRLLVQQPPSLTAATPDAVEAAAISSALAAAGFPGLTVQVNDKTIHVRGHLPRARQPEAMRTVEKAAPKATIVDETTGE